MTKLNRQEVFDAAYLGMASQDFRPSFMTIQGDSGKVFNQCVYRSPNGCRCAIGWTIPDDVYDEVMEDGFLANDLRENFPQVDNLYASDVSNQFLSDLQTTHDNKNFLPEWDIRSAMILFAKKQNITIPEIPKTEQENAHVPE